ncbi:MAG TPA: MraY family glycosyltransferase [Methylomirabilota bacterium]|nr:MraY family glycosyltransferase [Methylomirabilota bacterium]
MKWTAFAGAALPYLLAAFAAAALISFVLTPLVRRIALGLNAVDEPGMRRVNTVPVPRGGGVAVALAFIVVGIVLSNVNSSSLQQTPDVANDPRRIVALLLGGALATVFGVLDDYFDLRARWQFVGQLGLAAIAIGFGIVVVRLNNPVGQDFFLAQPFAVGFTVLWVVGMINSLNFIDGLDGLSSGVAIIAALTLGTISLSAGIAQPFIAALCFALAGALVGFLRWNFQPASIFIGTSGVMFVGYTLAILSILGTAKVAIALLVLGVPIIDAFWIIVRRLVQGRSPFSPDRGHLHHRLLDVGLSHRQTVVLIYAVCIVLGLLSLFLSGANQFLAFVGVFVLIGLLLFLLARVGVAGNGSPGEKAPDPGLKAAREGRSD